MTVHSYPAPVINVEIERYFDGAAAGRLLLKKCNVCGKTHFYPRALCPFCFADRTEWFESCGKGIIYSYSVMRRVEPVFAIAYVTLEEGVTMLSHIVDYENHGLRIGQSVKVVFKASDSGSLIPLFTPVCDVESSSPDPGYV